MTPRESHPDGDRPSSAEDAYARLLALRESGTAPDFETWVREYPEFEAELRELDGSWDHVGRSLERLLGTATEAPSIHSAAPLSRGLRVGEFVLERLIGAGGMGVVWLARQPALEREVALKFVRGDRESAMSPELFEREARAAGRVNDRRIVTIYAAGESEGRRWLAMEHVPGSRSLATWLGELRASGPSAGHARLAAAFVADVAEALHAGHELGVVHRDVKPQNLLVAPDGTPKLTDFGLARLVDEAALSETLTIRGTVEYMSPEQVSGDTHRLDRRSDVFSLGVVLYELLTLERPFTGVTPIEVITRIAASEPRRPSELVPGLDTDLDVIVAKALEKRPEERYPTALELARDLRRWLAHEPIGARQPSPWRRVAKWTRRNPLQALAAAAGTLLIVVVGSSSAWIWNQNRILRERERENLVVQTLWDIDNGRLSSAAEHVAGFYQLGDDDPEAHLVMAMGYARYLRFAEAQAEIEAAKRMGYSPEIGPEPGARESYLRALWLVAQLDGSRFEEANVLFLRAIELDPEMTQVWFPLYQVRLSNGDFAGAREALLNFRDSIPRNNDFWSIAEALNFDLDGHYADEVQVLETLESRVDATRARELRLHRHLGRARLGLVLEDPARAEEWLEDAEGALRQAVEQWEGDGVSWARLGWCSQLRANEEGDPVARAERWREAREFAERAQALGLGDSTAAGVLAAVAVDELGREFHAETTPESLLEQAEQRCEELRRLEPESGLLPNLDSAVAYYRGAFAKQRGDRSAARQHFAASVAASAAQVYARVQLGQIVYLDDHDFEAAQELFEQALEIWDRGEYGAPGHDPERERKWLFAAAIWRFGAADHRDDLAAARDGLGRAMDELARNDDGAEPEEILTLAEFLAMPVHAEFQDCDAALGLLDDYPVEQAFADRPAELELIETIRRTCP